MLVRSRIALVLCACHAIGCGRIGYERLTVADGGLDAATCVASSRRCRDGVPEQCNGANEWIALAPCTAGISACDDATGQCLCIAGTSVCAGGVQTDCLGDTVCELGCAGTRCLLDTVALPGLVTCDPDTGLYCDLSVEVCYETWSGVPTVVASCGDPSAPMPDAVRVACDGPNDCPAGFECCHGPYSLCAVECVPAGTCVGVVCSDAGPPQRICDPSAPDCTGGLSCLPLPMFTEPPAPGTPIRLFACGA